MDLVNEATSQCTVRKTKPKAFSEVPIVSVRISNVLNSARDTGNAFGTVCVFYTRSKSTRLDLRSIILLLGLL
jgi:hypothetical protein